MSFITQEPRYVRRRSKPQTMEGAHPPITALYFRLPCAHTTQPTQNMVTLRAEETTPACGPPTPAIDQLHVVGIYHFWKPIIFQNFWAMSFKNHWLTSYQNIYWNISFSKAVNKTCPCGVTIFTSHHKAITSSRLLQTRLLHQGVSRLLRHDDVDQSQTVSKSADFRCEKDAFLLIGESWE